MHKVLSIIVPVYNTAPYLERCVSSLVSQNKDSVEVILVDDGSNDGSEHLCDLYEKRYPFIKTLHKENGGLASARNAGLAASNGEYVNFLDSDDWLDDGSVNEILDVIEKCEPAIIGFGCKRTTGEAVYQKICQPWAPGMDRDMSEVRADIINDQHLFNFGIIRSSCMHVFKKKIIDDYSLRFISERRVLNEDFLFIAGFIMHAESYYNLKKCFYNYYTREGSLTQKHLANMYGRKKELLSRYMQLIEDIPDPLGKYSYRANLLFLDSCYECLANECSATTPDKKLISEILSDINNSDSLKRVDRAKQSAKAKIVLAVMSLNNANAYITYYRMFKALKGLTQKMKKGKGRHWLCR